MKETIEARPGPPAARCSGTAVAPAGRSISEVTSCRLRRAGVGALISGVGPEGSTARIAGRQAQGRVAFWRPFCRHGPVTCVEAPTAHCQESNPCGTIAPARQGPSLVPPNVPEGTRCQATALSPETATKEGAAAPVQARSMKLTEERWLKLTAGRTRVAEEPARQGRGRGWVKSAHVRLMRGRQLQRGCRVRECQAQAPQRALQSAGSAVGQGGM